MLSNIASTFRYATTSAFSVFLFLFLVAYTHYSFTSYLATQERIHQIHIVGDTLLYYDEVQTMSARMGAFTGDKSWQERYDKHLPLFDAAINEAYLLVEAAKSPMEKAKEAHKALIAIESMAFSLINADQKDEALRLLFNDTYLTNKQIYSGAFTEMMRFLDNSQDELTDIRNKNIIFAAAISIATFCLIVLNIIFTFRRLRLDNALLEKQLNIIDRYVISSSTNAKGIITAVSEAFCKISGYSREELIGRSHKILRHGDMPKETFEQLWQNIKSGKVWHGEIKNRKKNGDFYWVDATIEPEYDKQGKIIGYSALRFDITHKKEIEILALTDALTGLYNRHHFDELLPREIKSAARQQQPLSLLILDIDHFKEYNDTYGHPQGDIALKAVAGVIRSTLQRSNDTAFRIGGEEFCIIMPNTASAGASEVAQRVIDNVCGLHIEHRKSASSAFLSISVGVYTAIPDTYTSVKDIIEKADRFLYLAKQGGRNRYICEKRAAGSEEPAYTPSFL